MVDPLFASALLALSLGTIWTVDDDGPADFSTIGAAVVAAAEGDTIHVFPGQYPPFALGKRLFVVGQSGGPKPRVLGTIAAASPAGFTLSNLRAERLVVFPATGAVKVVDCVFEAQQNRSRALVVEQAQNLLAERCVFRGSQGPGQEGGDAARVRKSRAFLVQCLFQGGAGAIGPGLPDLDGGGGLEIVDSEVWIAGCTILGGGAGGDPLVCDLGSPGDGLELADSFASLRGGPTDLVLAGPPGPPPCGNRPGDAIDVEDSTLVWSGVHHGGISSDGSSSVVHAVPFEPFLLNEGPATPGTTNNLALYGPNGAQAVIFGSLDDGATAHPKVEGAIGFDPNDLFFVGVLSTTGIANAPNCFYEVPRQPAVIETHARFQAFFPGLPGVLDASRMRASNPLDVVPRP